MDKTFKIAAACLLAAASTLLLSSCAKELGGNGREDGAGRAPLSFSAGTSELIESRAAAVTSVSEFYTMGYDGTTQWFPTSGGPQLVQIPSGATFDDYKWVGGTNYTFYGYANMPSSTDVAEAAIASTGVTLTYKAVPTEASAQNDILLGLYSGDGDGTGTAAMTFYHPLAQVVFKMGNMAGISSIDKIEIQDVYGTGTTTLSTDTGTTSVETPDGGTTTIANFEWEGSGSATVSQTVGSLPAKDSEFGTPFMLIPQTLSTQNVTVSVTVTTTGSSSLTLVKKLTSGTFATGKKTVCTLTVNPNRELDCSLSLASYDLDASDDIFKTGTPLTLPGLFSVAEGKQVHFSRGNLYADGDNALHFEDAQWKSTPQSDGSKDANHVSHFTWSDNVVDAVGDSNSGDNLFCDEEHKQSVDGSEAIYYALSVSEWNYLFANHSKKWVTVNGVYGYVIAPDGFAGTLADTYADDAALAADELVFLPAAGYRYGSYVELGPHGYWSSSPRGDEAYLVYFSDSEVRSNENDFRDSGYSVRLIAESE